MTLAFVLGIIAAIAGGILLAKWLGGVPHRLRVRGYARILHEASLEQRLQLALTGHDEIFSKHDRDWLIELAFSEDKTRRDWLAHAIAEDAAERWHKMSTGKGPEMKSMMSDSEKAEVTATLAGLKDLAAAISLAERLKKAAKSSGGTN